MSLMHPHKRYKNYLYAKIQINSVWFQTNNAQVFIVGRNKEYKKTKHKYIEVIYKMILFRDKSTVPTFKQS